ncbi:ATPase [Thermococcus chitonophagus]|uniref:ATPase n=1 Tax=Thermococcus chitonophagus TaxID=54262 RepID=A0A160VUY6_9EURY|nr:S-layer protein [Thermococcus chitonophagus]ASJ16974.1 ATPase [Thermococcus chitonophagus]CUX78456.1 S-layer protein [Thermococcus chitonophagus]
MKVKKIAALAVGAAVAGATLGFASAQPQVPEIPKEFFVKDGQPNVKIVVGSEGAAMDVVSAADIAAAIGSLLYTEKDVKVEDVSVVVKKDITEPVAKIPVFDNYGASQPAMEADANPKTVDAWWNGSYDSNGNPYFNVNYTTSAWDGGTYTTPVSIKLSDIGALGGYDLDANLTLTNITLDNLASSDIDQVDEFKDFKVNITSVVANVSLVIYNYTLQGSPETDPITKETTTPTDNLITNLYLTDATLGKYYSDYSGYTITGREIIKNGTYAGDTLKLFGQTFSILAVGKNLITNQSCGNCFTYGTEYEEKFYERGDTESFDGYKVTILDIDTQREKALVKITSPSGEEITDTLYKDEPKVFFDGGIRIVLLDTFVGVAGTQSVKIKVWTNLKVLESGDDMPGLTGWKAVFNVTDTADGPAIKWFALENEDVLSGDTVKLFDQYVVDYKADIKKKEASDGTEYATLTAYVYVEPAEKQYDVAEVSKGDEIDDTGYVVDSVDVKLSPEETYIPSKLTEPITVLDTEIMEQGLENVKSNLILVGGPVVNKVTAALADALGVPETYEEWAANETLKEGVVIYKPECSKIGGYGVVLVAGADREGTRAAAEALLKYISEEL